MSHDKALPHDTVLYQNLKIITNIIIFVGTYNLKKFSFLETFNFGIDIAFISWWELLKFFLKFFLSCLFEI